MLVGQLIPWTVELCYYKGCCNFHRGRAWTAVEIPLFRLLLL